VLRDLARRTYLYGTWIMLVLIILQFTSAGAGVFSLLAQNALGAGILVYHATVGPSTILVLSLVMVLAAFVGRLPWRMTGLATSFVPLLALQSLFIIPYSYPQDIPALAGMPWLSALHVVNALFIFWLAFQWPAWTRRDLAAARPPFPSRHDEGTAPQTEAGSLFDNLAGRRPDTP
jgi:hypothetical protein